MPTRHPFHRLTLLRPAHHVLRYRRLSPQRRRVLWRLLAAQIQARYQIARRPFARIAVKLGHAQHESPHVAEPAALAYAQDIAWATAVLARRQPWSATCFAQALAAQSLLSDKGYRYTVYFGVAREQVATDAPMSAWHRLAARLMRHQRVGEPFAAHAWLRVGSLIVTGGPQHAHFQTIASFAPPER